MHYDFLATVKMRKIKWYDHVSRSSGLTKTILQGTVKETRSDGKTTSKNGQVKGLESSGRWLSGKFCCDIIMTIKFNS